MVIHVRGDSSQQVARRGLRGWRVAVAMAGVLTAILTIGLSGSGALDAGRSARVVRLDVVAADPIAKSSPSPSASPSASPSSPSLSPQDYGLVAEYLPRIPTFAERPVPQPVALPEDPQGRWLSRVPTQQPVAFITIDDGWTKLPVAPPLLRAANVPVSLFLAGNAIADNPGYFSAMPPNVLIEAHSLYHNNLRGKPYQAQLGDICGSANQLAGLYGRRPVLFRPPYGEKDAATLQASRECGMKAALFWTETVDKGVVRYQTGNQIQPGDIILMHFRPAFADDFLAALNAIHDAGLIPARLEDYLT